MRSALRPRPCVARCGLRTSTSQPPSEPSLRPRLLITLVGFGLALAAADARAQTPDDPYEAMNRRFFASAMHLNEKYFGPLVRLYHALTPGLIGVAIHN